MAIGAAGRDIHRGARFSRDSCRAGKPAGRLDAPYPGV